MFIRSLILALCLLNFVPRLSSAVLFKPDADEILTAKQFAKLSAEQKEAQIIEKQNLIEKLKLELEQGRLDKGREVLYEIRNARWWTGFLSLSTFGVGITSALMGEAYQERNALIVERFSEIKELVEVSSEKHRLLAGTPTTRAQQERFGFLQSRENAIIDYIENEGPKNLKTAFDHFKTNQNFRENISESLPKLFQVATVTAGLYLYLRKLSRPGESIIINEKQKQELEDKLNALSENLETMREAFAAEQRTQAEQ